MRETRCKGDEVQGGQGARRTRCEGHCARGIQCKGDKV